jgi:bacterioferritin-associated ferredoxin
MPTGIATASEIAAIPAIALDRAKHQLSVVSICGKIHQHARSLILASNKQVIQMNSNHSRRRLSAIASCLSIATILVPIQQGLTATPQVNPIAAKSAKSSTQSALARLITARRQLAQQVSNCNGGDILVRTCPGNVPPAAQSCQEPIAPCAIVEALKDTDRAIATLERFLHPSRNKAQSN